MLSVLMKVISSFIHCDIVVHLPQFEKMSSLDKARLSSLLCHITTQAPVRIQLGDLNFRISLQSRPLGANKV